MSQTLLTWLHSSDSYTGLTVMWWWQHSKEWWLAATLSTSIPVIYSFSGGMRASIMTDTTQLVICVGFFIALLAVLGSKMPTGWDWNPSGTPQALPIILQLHLFQ